MKTPTKTGYGIHDISRKIARRVQAAREKAEAPVPEHETEWADMLCFPGAEGFPPVPPARDDAA